MSKIRSKNVSIWNRVAIGAVTLSFVGTIGCSGGPYNNCYPYAPAGQVPVMQYPVQQGVLTPPNAVLPATQAPTLPLNSNVMPQGASVAPQTTVPLAGTPPLQYGYPIGTNLSQVGTQTVPQQINPSPGVYNPAAHTASVPYTDKSAQGLIKF